MKKSLCILLVLMASALASHAQMRIGMDVILGKRPPNREEARAMRREEQAHPNIANSLASIQNAMVSLNNAPDNFGGHKAQAYADLQQAYWSLRKALYYRLYEDRH